MFASRHIVLWGILLSGVCLTYFCLLDNEILSTAHFSPIFRVLLINYDTQFAWLSAGICLLAAFWRNPRPVLSVADFIASRPVWISLITTTVLAVCTIWVYHNHPLSMDEYAAVFQSKVFAAWHVTAKLPPHWVDWLVVSGFNGEFLLASPDSGRAIEVYWPGFAILLAPFQAANLPYLCNPILAGVSLYLIYRITLDLTRDSRAAGFAVLFALGSGAFVANAISYYSMQAHLTCNLLFAWLLLKPTRFRAIAGGIVGSVALILHNPLPHLLFVVPFFAAMATSRADRKHLIYLILGYLPIAVVVGLGWTALRSSVQPDVPALSGLASKLGSAFHWPNEAILSMRLAAIAKVWVWSVPCLIITALVGFARFRKNRAVVLLFCSAALTFAGYLFVSFDQGHGWGYRYFHSAWGVLPILAGCAMTSRDESSGRIAAFAGSAAVLSLLILVPYQMSRIEQFVSGQLAQLAPARRPGNNVYFVHPGQGFYAADLIQQDPELSDRDLIVVSHGYSMDDEFVHRNWPQAARVGSSAVMQQWYLGDTDQRRSDPIAGEKAHFTFAPETKAIPQQ